MSEIKIRHYFKEGDIVAHKEAPLVRMEVRRIIRRKAREDLKPDGSVKVFTMGIECGWWKEKGNYTKEVFHTKSIIPWDIAEMGHIEILKWLEGH